MVEELRKELERKKSGVNEVWSRIEELEKEIPESLPSPEAPKKLEDKTGTSPLKKAIARIGFRK